MYVRNGGGAIFAFQTARNESTKFPKAGQMDLSPLIYDVDSWVMEWDNLTEVFNARFIDDIVLGNSTVSNTNTVHPIPNYDYTSKPQTMKKNEFGAAQPLNMVKVASFK